MVCPTTAFAAWDSTNLCVVLSFIVDNSGPHLRTPDGKMFQIQKDLTLKFISIHLHLNKASSPESLKGWVNYMEKQTSRTIKEIRMDNAGKYTLKKFEEWCKTKGIDHQTSAPHKKNQNRITENAIHQVKTMA